MKNFFGSLVLSCLIATPIVANAGNMDKCLKALDAREDGNYKQAVTLFEQCIDEGNLSNAILARTYRNLGITYRRMHEFEKAILSYNKAISLNPTDVIDDYINRGNAYDEDGKFNEALADYNKALELNPNYGEAHYNKGIAYENNKMFNEARDEFIKAYKSGLRSSLLYERFVVYGLIKE